VGQGALDHIHRDAGRNATQTGKVFLAGTGLQPGEIRLEMYAIYAASRGDRGRMQAPQTHQLDRESPQRCFESEDRLEMVLPGREGAVCRLPLQGEFPIASSQRASGKSGRGEILLQGLSGQVQDRQGRGLPFGPILSLRVSLVFRQAPELGGFVTRFERQLENAVEESSLLT